MEALHQQVLTQDPCLDPAAEKPTLPAEEPANAEAAPGTPWPTAPFRATARRGFLRGVNRRRWASVTAVALVTVAVLTGWALFVRRADVTPLPANSVGPVDSRGSRGDPALLDSAPSAMVHAGGAIWAAEGDSDTVVRIGLDDRRVTQTVRGVGRNPQAMAALGDDLWVAFREQVVTRVDMAIAQAGHRNCVGNGPVAVVAGPSGVWVANNRDNTIVRIDPATERIDAPVFVGDGPTAGPGRVDPLGGQRPERDG